MAPYQIVLHDDDDCRNVAWHIIDAHEAITVFTDQNCKANDCRVIYFADGQSSLLQESALVNRFTDISTFDGHIMLRHMLWPKMEGRAQINASNSNRSAFVKLIISKGHKSIRQKEPQKLVIVPLHIHEDRADRRSTTPRGPQFPDFHFQRC